METALHSAARVRVGSSHLLTPSKASSSRYDPKCQTWLKLPSLGCSLRTSFQSHVLPRSQQCPSSSHMGLRQKHLLQPSTNTAFFAGALSYSPCSPVKFYLSLRLTLTLTPKTPNGIGATTISSFVACAPLPLKAQPTQTLYDIWSSSPLAHNLLIAIHLQQRRSILNVIRITYLMVIF